jgi:hypothetical protein
MCIDHEEACLVYGIKHNRQCARCEVEFDALQDINTQWQPRSEERMRARVAKQNLLATKKDDPQWVHPNYPFFWSHSLSDMHENVAVDMLHGLQKGVFRNLVDMTLSLVYDLFPAERATKELTKAQRTYKQSAGLVRLDARFNEVPRFQGLKHFNKFTQVTQWTGGEERDLIRVWIPVLAPLLKEKAPHALAYSRALIDFILIAQSRSHDEATIGYLEQALFRIDLLKGAFARYRPKSDKEAHWNTPKFHMLSHYAEFIRRFGAPNGFDTEHLEAPHKFLLKQFYDRTNKNDEYLIQIAEHNTRANNLKAMAHRVLFYFTTTSEINIEVPTRVTTCTKTPLSPKEFGCPPLSDTDKTAIRVLYHPVFKPSTCTTAGNADRGLELSGFLEALGLFVYKERRRRQGKEVLVDPENSCKGDFSWVCPYPVQFLGAIRCWKRTGTDETNSEAQGEELLRCNPNWRGKGPRGDFCWVQAFPRSVQGNSKAPVNPRNGERVGQIRVILAILDIGFPVSSLFKSKPTYYGAMVDVYPFRGEDEQQSKWPANLGRPDPLHGMIEVTRAPVPTAKKPRKLQGRRFFRMDDIYRSAHVVPGTNNEQDRSTDVFYINNYIDWDQYQDLIDDDWEESGKRQALAMKKQM